MHKREDIKRISEFFIKSNIDLPEVPGIYAFWWVGDRQKLLDSNRKLILSGPQKTPVSVFLDDWWPQELNYPCLYVGKSTNIKKRFSQHIRRGSRHRLHTIEANGRKIRPVTSSCQLRYGIEHIFRDEGNPLEVIYDEVGFSYKTYSADNSTVERFYEEDYLIGKWRPWFNLDSER